MDRDEKTTTTKVAVLELQLHKCRLRGNAVSYFGKTWQCGLITPGQEHCRRQNSSDYRKVCHPGWEI